MLTDNDQELTFSQIWETITKRQNSGGLSQLLGGDSDIEASLEISYPENEPSLIVETDSLIDFDSEDLKPTSYMEVDAKPTGRGGMRVSITLLDSQREEFFLYFASDVVPKMRSAADNQEAAHILLRRFRTWRSTWKDGKAQGLSKNAQLGLYGELKTLEKLIDGGIDRSKSIAAWTGPNRAKQDFQINGIAIEVKSIVHAEPQKLSINGERQLDETFFDALVITHHRIHRQIGAGETLPEVVHNIRDLLKDDSLALDLFEQKLLESKYLDAHNVQYKDSGYGVTETHYYRVQPGFPNITESMLPIGVGSVRYVIDASACTNFAIDEETVFAWLTDNVAVEKLSDATMETVHEEYKKSVWKPTDKQHQGLNEKAKTAISKRLNGAIAKTVASFLNTEGGTLIIGKDDDGIITGIEEDMEFKKFKNLDEYQRALYQLLKNTIDEGIAGKVRIRFEEKNGLNVCLVHVKRSPTPHFCDDLESETKQRLLFIREDGASPPLSPDRYAAYFQEHF